MGICASNEKKPSAAESEAGGTDGGNPPATLHNGMEISHGGCSVKGARDQNEDAHNSYTAQHYAFSFVADGHGGARVAKVLGDAFERAMIAAIDTLEPNATPEEMVDCLREAYHLGTAAVDDMSIMDQGSTLSALLLQYGTMTCGEMLCSTPGPTVSYRVLYAATLQLGDCMVIVASEGNVLPANTLFKVDDAGDDEYEDFTHCVTHQHGWLPGGPEVTRANRMLRADSRFEGASLGAQLRAQVSEDERRYDMVLSGIPGWSDAYCVECSRTVDLPNDGGARINELLFMLHRPPQFAVWQLPSDVPLTFIICCDGFVSKSAVSSAAKIARCVADPELYVDDPGCLDGTLIVDWGIVDPAELGKGGLLTKTAEKMKGAVPDDMWLKAIDDSQRRIDNLRAEFSGGRHIHGRVPPLNSNIQAAVSMACNIPVVFGSDDNVTLEVLHVT